MNTEKRKKYKVEDSPAINNERYSLETTIVELNSNKTSWFSLKSMALVTIQNKKKKAGPLGVFHTRTQYTHDTTMVCIHVLLPIAFLDWPTVKLYHTAAAPMTLECILVIADLLMGRGSQRWCHYAIASGPVVQHATHLIPSTQWEFTYKAMLHKIHQYKSLMDMNYSLQAIKILLMIRWRYLRLW